jgi:ribosomal protein S18 acetylase RimI-like enzyme
MHPANPHSKMPKDAPPILIRPARPSEYKTLGNIAAVTYFPTSFSDFLSPNRIQYYSHYARGFQQRALTLMLQPRVRSLVAVESTRPDLPIAYIHFERLGDDETARRYIREKESVRLWVYRWLAWAWWLLIAVVIGNKAADPENQRTFIASAVQYRKTFWDPYEERQSRFHVLSFVVLPQFQGRGVGTRLLAEVTSRAERENVVIGLEASPEGEIIVSQLRPLSQYALRRLSCPESRDDI